MNHDRIQLLRESSNVQVAPESRGYESLGNPVSADSFHQNVASTPRLLRQYVATISATLSALAAGAVLGWTSPIMEDLQNRKFHNISINDNQMGWVGSFVTLGAMTMCFPTGFICDLIGRKRTLLLLIVPFTLGWFLILFGNSIAFIYLGRLITGMAAGACCVSSPIYISEIASKSVRGTLGSYFQLMVTIGIFLAYLFGKILKPIEYTVFCTCLPVVFFVLFVFQPESPVYLMKIGLHEQARRNLIYLRGAEYDISSELAELEGVLKESGQTATSIRRTFARKSNLKGLLIALMLMFFQQFSGINAVVLYTSDIFTKSGVHLDANLATIFVGAFQAIATFISSLVVDKLGRRVLLLFSCFVMGLSTLILAVYFTLKYRSHIDSHIIDQIGFLPVVALCILVVFFAAGLGPIPWIISSEIFPPEVKSIASSGAGTFNWFLAFIITRFYLQVCSSIGQDSVFYGFTVILGFGLLFVYFVVPETKGKSIEEIQFILGS